MGLVKSLKAGFATNLISTDITRRPGDRRYL
jgi:hypothetical protein